MTQTSEADVVVVGGGIVGVACAYYLARAGRRVTVVEKGLIAGGASGRNGGHLSPSIDDAWAPLARLALDTWPMLAEEIDGPTEYCRGGGLYVVVGTDPTDPRDLLAYRHERGFVAELVSPEDCRKRLPGLTSEIKGGVLSPRHGQVNPILTARSLAATAEHLGVRFLINTEVTDVLVHAGAVAGVQTPAGRLSAPVVVDAAGPWAADIARMAGIDCPVTPRRIQILLSEHIPRRLTDLIWAGNGLYVRQARAGQLPLWLGRTCLGVASRELRSPPFAGQHATHGAADGRAHARAGGPAHPAQLVGHDRPLRRRRAAAGGMQHTAWLHACDRLRWQRVRDRASRWQDRGRPGGPWLVAS